MTPASCRAVCSSAHALSVQACSSHPLMQVGGSGHGAGSSAVPQSSMLPHSWSQLWLIPRVPANQRTSGISSSSSRIGSGAKPPRTARGYHCHRQQQRAGRSAPSRLINNLNLHACVTRRTTKFSTGLATSRSVLLEYCIDLELRGTLSFFESDLGIRLKVVN